MANLPKRIGCAVLTFFIVATVIPLAVLVAWRAFKDGEVLS